MTSRLTQVAWQQLDYARHYDLGCEGLPIEARPIGARDVTGDGPARRDVAVARSGTTSSWPEILMAVDGASRSESPRLLGQLLTYDDGTDGRGLRVEGALTAGPVVVVSARASKVTDPNAIAAVVVVDSFT